MKERKNITIEGSIWAKAVVQAAANGRSVSNYIEQLIKNDKKKEGKK